MKRDLHNNFQASRGMSPVAATTDNTAYVSQIIDTADFGSTEFVALMGAIGNGAGACTVLVEDGNAANLSDNATVDSSYLIGASTLVMTANKTWKIGYIGPKRYVRVTITPSGNTGNLFLCGLWVQSHAKKMPLGTQLN